MTKSPPFKYVPDDRKCIREHFEKLGKASRFELSIEALERSADWYLFKHAWAKALRGMPEIEVQHAEDLESLRRARKILVSSCGPTFQLRNERAYDGLDDDEAETGIADEIDTMYRKFQSGQISGGSFLQVMGAWAIDDLIALHGNESPEARWIKDSRKKQHRRTFLKDVATLWADLNGKDLSNCTISAVDGSPMLDFIKACIEPVTAVTGEFAGDETIKIIVGELKRESQKIGGELERVAQIEEAAGRRAHHAMLGEEELAE